jgi:kynurenine 3-monooxygenase
MKEDKSQNTKKITILGAGLVGSMLSIMLKRMGYAIEIFDKRADQRKSEVIGRRSINLALSHRGWKALESLGLTEEVNKIAMPMYGRAIHGTDEIVKYQAYGLNQEAIYSVSRKNLGELLLNTLEKHDDVQINFDHNCLGVVIDEPRVFLETQNDKKRFSKDANLIIGTDGVFSIVRDALKDVGNSTTSEEYLEQNYRQLNLPADSAGNWQLDKNTLHIWPRGNYMMIALPNMDGTFTCTLFMPRKGENSFEQIKDEKDLLAFFRVNFSDVLSKMPDLVEEYYSSPESGLFTVRCSSWYHQDKVLIMGDAAHGIVPFYGQGMNSGFEDCMEFQDLLNQTNPESVGWGNILQTFFENRKPNADAIATLSLENFVEMSDKVGDSSFLLRKQIEVHLCSLYPNNWTHTYSLVAFSDIPYSQALAIKRKQDLILDKIMDYPNIEMEWQNLNYDSWIFNRPINIYLKEEMKIAA